MTKSDRQNRDYQLLDFGHGKKLERFGRQTLCRPCPAAENDAPYQLNLWREAELDPRSLPATDATLWVVEFELSNSVSLQLELSITPFGHVGVFPEQWPHWKWLYEQARDQNNQSLRALNLFAYTGGSTLALALAGTHVVHVDASAPSVHWARTNAKLNNLESHPIRWIVEDARKFVEREIRRGNTYQIIVLDPPSYGHGPSGRAWNLERDWRSLLQGCLQLLSPSSSCSLLWTGHSQTPELKYILQELSEAGLSTQSARSQLFDSGGRSLDAGYYIRAHR